MGVNSPLLVKWSDHSCSTEVYLSYMYEIFDIRLHQIDEEPFGSRDAHVYIYQYAGLAWCVGRDQQPWCQAGGCGRRWAVGPSGPSSWRWSPGSGTPSARTANGPSHPLPCAAYRWSPCGWACVFLYWIAPPPLVTLPSKELLELTGGYVRNLVPRQSTITYSIARYFIGYSNVYEWRNYQ